MKTNTKFDWDEMVEAMAEGALESHKWFGKGTLDGKDSPEESLAYSLEAFSEACYDRLQELTEGDIT